jgi:type II secretion system protein N
MKRVLVFAALLVAFLLWTFPHDLVVRHLLASRLGGSGVVATVRDVHPRIWPLGYRLDELVLSQGGFRASIDSLRIGIGLTGGFRFSADACAGALSGTLDRRRGQNGDATRVLDLRFDEVDPSTCLELVGPTVGGRFSGVLALEGLGKGTQAAPFARAGLLTLEGREGSLSGYLPSARPPKASGKRREPQPIGSWEFTRMHVDARLDSGRIVVTRGEAEAEGLQWETAAAKIDISRSTPRIEVELRAKRLDDSARSKAILALLPKATEKDGWRRYRIVGTTSSIQLAGIK